MEYRHEKKYVVRLTSEQRAELLAGFVQTQFAVGHPFQRLNESILAKSYGGVEIDPNHFFSQAIEVVCLTSILYEVNGTVVTLWKEFLHKIISFTEDIYDRIIKVHFFALHGQWNNSFFSSSIDQRAFLYHYWAKTCTRR